LSVRASVFFNEKQRLQRDLTTLALAVYAETTGAPPRSLAVLDALAASGVRGLRYALEVPAVGTAVLNDASDEAVAAMRENARLSGFAAARERGSYLHAGGARLEVSQGDAVALMRARRRHFDAVDLDPYGCVAELLPAAVESLRDGGLLCASCTDLGALSGRYGDGCARRYGADPLRAAQKQAPELALRLLLGCVSRAAQGCAAAPPSPNTQSSEHRTHS